VDPNRDEINANIQRLSEFSARLEDRCREDGMEVQSRRLATPSFTTFLCPKEGLIGYIRELEALAKSAGFGYMSFGPALPPSPESYISVPEILRNTTDVFLGAVIADEKQVHPRAVEATAQIIREASTITPDGFTNLRFAALANVRPGAPFLPAAHHQTGAGPAFALAIECAAEVLQAFEGQTSLAEARHIMLSSLENIAMRIEKVINKVTDLTEMEFLGFDFSPAPFPEDSSSLAGAIEAAGHLHLGSFGSLSAAAVIADALDRGNWRRTGFNGLMLPVLEDSILAKRAASGELAVKDLLLYSAVCGTGLDTVPLPGDCSVEELTSLLMDVASLSVRLGKPLTARLMPLPGMAAGDETHFSFDYFANSRVMSLDSQSIGLPLLGDESISLAPKHTYHHS
jgi:uncharacterized protein (UPF0210 family)